MPFFLPPPPPTYVKYILTKRRLRIPHHARSSFPASSHTGEFCVRLSNFHNSIFSKGLFAFRCRLRKVFSPETNQGNVMPNASCRLLTEKPSFWFTFARSYENQSDFGESRVSTLEKTRFLRPCRTKAATWVNY